MQLGQAVFNQDDKAEVDRYFMALRKVGLLPINDK